MLEPITPENDEPDSMELFARDLASIKLLGCAGKEIPVPESIQKLLMQVVPILRSGQAISIVAIERLLTTEDAAKLLNVSRPYLIKLLEDGVVPFERPDGRGTHRRIRFEDLMEYKHKRDIARREQLRKLTQLSQEAGFYEE